MDDGHEKQKEWPKTISISEDIEQEETNPGPPKTVAKLAILVPETMLAVFPEETGGQALSR
jgi:hypothetical protein